MLYHRGPILPGLLLYLQLSVILDAAELLWSVHSCTRSRRLLSFPHGGKTGNYLSRISSEGRITVGNDGQPM